MKFNNFISSMVGCAFGVICFTGNAQATSTWVPKRVLIAVFDQMRPDYVDTFGMTHLRQLRDSGMNFHNGYVGHTASETLVSHNVMVSGQLPKNMGWTDEVFRDSNNVLGKGKDAIWISGNFGGEEFGKLVKHAGYPKLADYLHQAQPGTKFIVVGEKDYAVEAIAAPTADIAVHYSDRNEDVSAASGCDNLGGQWRGPAGVNVPSYLSEPKCGRFYINSDEKNNYGTATARPSWMYPLDGNRFVPGNDPKHLGGDAWVADAAIAMAEKENWSGMLVTFGAIDKAGHMWGAGKPDALVKGAEEQTQLPYLAKYADEQFGRLLEKLKALGQLDDTLIIITADHGGINGLPHFQGNNEADAGDYNWYYGQAVNESDLDKPVPAIKPLLDTGNVAFNYQATHIHTWLKDTSIGKKQEMAKVMRTLPGVVATYWRDGDHYQLDTATGTSSMMSPAEQTWWNTHAQELLDTMASGESADVVGVLEKGFSYSLAGDHGGIQEDEQRIPMFVWSSHMQQSKPDDGFRLVDIVPTVLKAMQITPSHSLDGKAYPLQLSKE